MLKLTLVAASLLATAALPSFAQTDRETELMQRIDKLEKRLVALEAGSLLVSPVAVPAAPAIQQTAAALPSSAPSAAPSAYAESTGGFLSGTTLSLGIDGYYGYNFNRPVGRVNPLRAYDVTSNSFALSQASLIIERAPDASASKRLGYRVDLMYGQSTEANGGSALNENRPQVYRNIYQAYGTVVAPLGKGLTVDFGKFSSSLGFEGNYAKDQFNYTRSFLFNALPFYHFGARSTYAFNDRVSLQYWLVNGIGQSEDFNGFKSNAFLLSLKPSKSVVWNVNYYFGEESRDTNPLFNPGFPTIPTQPGLSADIIRPRPDGKIHIFDTNASWSATGKLTLVAQGDYIVNRSFHDAAPIHLLGGAAYAKYQFNNSWALAGRFEYLSDRGGFFSGTTQALKDTTLTATYQFADGLQLRGEYRGDFSNQLFFLTGTPGKLKRRQDTATLGILYWLGGKQGSW